MDYIAKLKDVSKKDVLTVGGKNASLGEMLSVLGKKGVRVPDGFVLTTYSYQRFLKENNLEKKLADIFAKTDLADIKVLQKIGDRARKAVLKSSFPKDLEQAIIESYRQLSKEYGTKQVDVAVRSSGVAEDAPQDSFAGQFESFLNISGEKQLLSAIKNCFASSFGDRVIAYREEKKIDHLKFAISVGVQKMIRSDKASSGVIFTLDTETGFKNIILINSIWGLGEMLVKGKITPDEFYVFKPTLKDGYPSIIRKNLGRKDQKLVYAKKGGLKEASVANKEKNIFSLKDKEILLLAKWATIIEEHYGCPQDIEWAKDGDTGDLFIVQSRPETVHAGKNKKIYKEYKIETKKEPILKGIAIGEKIGVGKARIISDVSKLSQFQKGEILVTKMTDPDWVPAMRLASAIVTDEGSKVCHAAIVSRELGVPCIVGTMEATEKLKTGETITVDCTQGLSGRVFQGEISYCVQEYDLKTLPKLETKIMVNIGVPEMAFKTSFLPVSGVGLAREEFIIAEKIKVHPLALLNYNEMGSKLKQEIDRVTQEHEDKREFFVKELAEGIAQIAAAFYPREVIVRFSDFKTNEYRNLIGGEVFEKLEANPMLGFRGAARYLDKEFQPAFKMECEAIKRAREKFGLKNITVMVPFCRTVAEGEKVASLIEQFGLRRGQGLKVYVMCEIPSNAILADDFLEIFDGMSIGSNDLTQLSLGIDRDNARLAASFDERNLAVKELVGRAIEACQKKGKYSGICGQAPSDFIDFAQFLVEKGIDSISLSPDRVVRTIFELDKLKQK